MLRLRLAHRLHKSVSPYLMETINQNNLLYFLLTNKIDGSKCDHSFFFEWNNGNDDLKNDLINIGKINLKPAFKENGNYWGKNAPIELNKYPYFGCEVYKCKKCNSLFFHYTELGGHGSQKRYRLIRKELIDIESFEPEERTLIDLKSYIYAVYKKPDMTYELSICKAGVGVGIDIYHIMDKGEEQKYLKKGIESLKSRMEDMDANYSNYEVVSWR